MVHEPHWTATARHADIVLPVTTTLEREDLGAAHRDSHLIAMHRAVGPVGEARDDYDVLSGVETVGLPQLLRNGEGDHNCVLGEPLDAPDAAQGKKP